MQQHLRRTKKVNEATHHDIKLDLDVRCQRLIERTLAAEPAVLATPIPHVEGRVGEAVEGLGRRGATGEGDGVRHAGECRRASTPVAMATGVDGTLV